MAHTRRRRVTDKLTCSSHATHAVTVWKSGSQQIRSQWDRKREDKKERLVINCVCTDANESSLAVAAVKIKKCLMNVTLETLVMCVFSPSVSFLLFTHRCKTRYSSQAECILPSGKQHSEPQRSTSPCDVNPPKLNMALPLKLKHWLNLIKTAFHMPEYRNTEQNTNCPGWAWITQSWSTWNSLSASVMPKLLLVQFNRG